MSTSACVVRRSAHDEVVGGRSPDFPQPLEIRLESAGRQHDRARRDRFDTAVHRHRHGRETAVLDFDPRDLGVVQHANAQPLGCGVIAVHQRLAAAEKEHVRAVEVQRPLERRLQSPAERTNPRRAIRRVAHDAARQRFVRPAPGDAHQVGQEFVFAVSVDEQIGRAIVHRAQVAGVAAVASAKFLRRAFDHDDGRAGLPGGQRRAQSRVAASEHGDVYGTVRRQQTRVPL